MHPSNIILESCVETLDQAIEAEQRGAHQLELCSRLDLDGLSPELSLIEEVLSKVQIPVKVMVRVRGGNFHYNPSEIQGMLDYVHEVENMGVQNFVFGALNEDRTIDFGTLHMMSTVAPDASFT